MIGIRTTLFAIVASLVIGYVVGSEKEPEIRVESCPDYGVYIQDLERENIRLTEKLYGND